MTATDTPTHPITNTPTHPINDTTTHRTIVVLVENKAGVLARVADLFARRGYNIVSLAVAPTNNERFSRLTIVVDIDSAPLDQIVKQLFKLINVVEIRTLCPAGSIERELLVAVVRVDRSSWSELYGLVRSFGAKVLARSSDMATVSLDDEPGMLDRFEHLLGDHQIVEMHRTGRIGITHPMSDDLAFDQPAGLDHRLLVLGAVGR